MKYPNQRYGNPAALTYYAAGLPVQEIARRLKRSERSIRNWLSGAEKLPWWVPEILRLQQLERDQRLRQMNIQPVRVKLGLVGKTATLYELPRRELPSMGRPDPVPSDATALDARQA
ncbi:helix-turn-helix domain-containing protein [Collimonas silvisoli]|uniref:helix-turn-helix domain-containing protein n=1 Tax=Collimonas silvisoli TaxID=2825884 RepID=UPI001B8C96E3|nr:helix-turn-helix domain-containing protein [Collimonas silvisoli]